MSIINIGVLGCATIAERSVIPAILSLPNKFNLVAIASRTKEKAEKFAQKFNCEAVISYDALISREDISALYIPLPTGLHEEWINKAILSGKHVYAEKSIAYNLASAETMVHNAKSAKVALMEGFMFQYHSQHEHIKSLLKEGIIGDIRHFSASFGFPPLNSDNFRYDKIIGGGAIFDSCAYPVRAAFFILGDNLKVESSSVFFDKNTNSSIYGSAFMKGKNGIGASLAFGFDNFYQCNYQIWGSKGKITVNRAFTPKPDQIPTLTIETSDKTEIIELPADNHFIKAFSEFHSIILNENLRGKHFKEIVQQSEALELIEKLAQ
jgi:predicted dehydrogenase